MLSHEGVWQATADDIAQHYIDNYYDEMVAHLKERDYR